jgi:hypothetical protein
MVGNGCGEGGDTPWGFQIKNQKKHSRLSPTCLVLSGHRWLAFIRDSLGPEVREKS